MPSLRTRSRFARIHATPLSRASKTERKKLTKGGEEAGRGLLVGRVYATHGVLDHLGAVHKVEIDRRRISGHEGLSGPACACAAEGCHLLDFAGASIHAEADSTLAGGTGHHRDTRRECGRASCIERKNRHMSCHFKPMSLTLLTATAECDRLRKSHFTCTQCSACTLRASCYGSVALMLHTTSRVLNV
jgi:hypothetical protein